MSESLAGTTVDEIVKIGRWKTDRVASYYIGVDNLYTGPTIKEKTGPRLRDRERVAVIPGSCVSFLHVRAKVRARYT